MPKGVITKQRYKKLIKTTVLGVSIVVVISLLANIGVLVYKKYYDNKVKSQIVSIDKKIGAQTDSTIQNVIREKIDYKNDVYDNLKKYTFDVTGVLNKIEKIIPADVSISLLGIDLDGGVTVEGQADNEDSVLDFFYNIKNSGLTDYVKFEGLDGKFGDPKGFKFSFEFQLKDIGSDIIETIKE